MVQQSVCEQDNLIEIDPSPVMHDDNWIGVVCCAIFYAGNERGMIFRMPKRRVNKIFPVDLRTDVVIDQSDHMWLFYLSRQQIDDEPRFTRYPSYHGVIILQCVKRIISGSEFGKMKTRYDDADVKKYGYRWV